MALNSDFKVKDSLYVGNSACFVTCTDTPHILSAGTELFDIFLQEGEIAASCTLSNGTAIGTFSFDGSADVSVGVDATCNTTWNSAYTTTQANSASWVNAATWCTTNGDNVIDTVAEGNAQGRIAVTDIGNTTSQIDVNGLQTNDSPEFAGACFTGAITTSSTIDGRDVACDGVTLDTLQSLSGDNGLTFSSPSQGTLRVTEADGDTTDVDLQVQTGDSVQFVGICATGNITTSGTVDGRDVACDGVTTDTLRSLSGDSVTGAGANTTQGCVVLSQADGTTVNADTGLTTSDSVQFVGVCTTGNITTSGTVDGRDVAADGTTTDTLRGLSAANLVDAVCTSQGTFRTENASGTCTAVDLGLTTGDIPTFAGLDLTGVGASTDNTVLILDGSTVATDEIDSRVWGSSLVDGSGTANKVTLWSDGNTIGNSNITQDTNGDIQIAGGLSATGALSGDGTGLTGVTATPTFPTVGVTGLVAADKIFVNNGTTCQTACNRHITYSNLLTDLAGTNMGLEVDSTDSLALKNYSSLTNNKVSKWDSANGQFIDSIMTEDTGATCVNVAGSLTVMDNLSVMGTFTCLDTSVSVTSALSVINTGTGPALYAEQTGVSQPIAKFVDTEGGQMVIGDTGNVGIGGSVDNPSEKLVVTGNTCVSGNITAGGTLSVDGNVTLGNASGDSVDICAATINAPNIPDDAHNGSKVLTINSASEIVLDGVDSKIFDTKLVDSNTDGTCQNQIPKFSNTTGTITSSNISDTGSLVTIDSDTIIDAGHKLRVEATTATYVERATFTATVDSTETTVTTLPASNLKSIQYHVTLVNGVNVTTFKVNAVHNGTDECGTTYAIVDAQAASQLADVEISSAGSTMDLDITAAADGTTAIIEAVGTYTS